MDFSFNSVELIPNMNAAAAFTVNTSEVFKESEDTTPITIARDMAYMPWGADNNMPYKILELMAPDNPCNHHPPILGVDVSHGHASKLPILLRPRQHHP